MEGQSVRHFFLSSLTDIEYYPIQSSLCFCLYTLFLPRRGNPVGKRDHPMQVTGPKISEMARPRHNSQLVGAGEKPWEISFGQ